MSPVDFLARYDRIRAARDAGAPLKTIADSEGLTPQRVCQILNRTPPPTQAPSRNDGILARNLAWKAEYEAGRTCTQIAAAAGLHPRYVLRCLRWAGARICPRGRPRKPAKPLAVAESKE